MFTLYKQLTKTNHNLSATCNAKTGSKLSNLFFSPANMEHCLTQRNSGSYVCAAKNTSFCTLALAQFTSLTDEQMKKDTT